MAFDVNVLALAGVRGLQPYEPGKPIEALEREYGISNAIKLASNENPLGPGKRALSAIEREVGELGRYPDGNGSALKRKLAQKHGVDVEQITLGNGSNDVLELVTRAFVSSSHEVIFSRHSFAVYPIVTQAVGARAVVTPVRDWGYDLDLMAKAITDKTRVVFIANPNNPTGTWLAATELHQFVATLPEHVICVVDEAYADYVDFDDYPDATAWLSEFDNLLVTRTFSKIHGLAGLRIGYGVSGTGIADMLNRVRQPFNVNSLAMVAAESALADDDHITKSRQLNRDGLVQLQTAFERMGLDYIPSAGNFVSVDIGRSGAEVYEQLLQRGVIVRPVANYEMPNHLRVTVGTNEENTRFIASLSEVLVNK
ncbi:MAG: histidinol-phosphate transaminase [Acidiferrobacterales bacterium]